jgi:hypothetical protein
VLNPILGEDNIDLRLIFVCLTQIVLITVLISILSNQFAKYNARDQYHFLFGMSNVCSD